MLYRHYKNKLYKFLQTVRHSEGLEDLALYLPLENNPDKTLWVRPKKMFFENVELNGKQIPRFAKIDFHFTTSISPTGAELQKVAMLLNSAFGSYNIEQLESRLEGHSQILLVSAYLDGDLIGCKLGYESEPGVFYSWLGAVKDKFQGLGVGQKLMDMQHDWCVGHSYNRITTKTLNRWQSMLILNIKNGFTIVGVEPRNNGEPKILMEKSIN